MNLGELGDVDVRRMSSVGGTRFCERRDLRVAAPSFPVGEVRASILRMYAGEGFEGWGC